MFVYHSTTCTAACAVLPRVPAGCRKWPQEDIYRHCLRSFRGRHQFIGFIDSDEVRHAVNLLNVCLAYVQRLHTQLQLPDVIGAAA